MLVIFECHGDYENELLRNVRKQESRLRYLIKEKPDVQSEAPFVVIYDCSRNSQQSNYYGIRMEY